MDAPPNEDIVSLSGWLHYWQGLLGIGIGWAITALTIAWRGGSATEKRLHDAKEIIDIKDRVLRAESELTNLRERIAGQPDHRQFEAWRLELREDFRVLHSRLDAFSRGA